MAAVTGAVVHIADMGGQDRRNSVFPGEPDRQPAGRIDLMGVDHIKMVLLMQSAQFFFRCAEKPYFGAAPFIVEDRVIEFRRFLHSARRFSQYHDAVPQFSVSFRENIHDIFHPSCLGEERGGEQTYIHDSVFPVFLEAIYSVFSGMSRPGAVMPVFY